MKEWESEVIDFGTVKVGSHLEGVFKYVGSDTLIGADFKRTCSCTDLLWDPQRNELKAVLNSSVSGYRNTTIKARNIDLILKAVIE